MRARPFIAAVALLGLLLTQPEAQASSHASKWYAAEVLVLAGIYSEGGHSALVSRNYAEACKWFLLAAVYAGTDVTMAKYRAVELLLSQAEREACIRRAREWQPE